LIKIIIKEENFKWHLEAFASELFKCFFFLFMSIILSVLTMLCYSNLQG